MLLSLDRADEMIEALDPPGSVDQDRDQVDTIRDVGRQIMRARIGLGEGKQAAALGLREALFGRHRAVGAAGAHLNKNKLVALPGNQIDLAVTAAPVRIDNSVAGAQQMRAGQRLAEVAQPTPS